MSKGKGGSTSSATEIPAWLENAAIENINKARDVSQIGYTPYYGADVAAFSPMQQQAMQATGGAASAFGLAPQGFDAMAGMPQAQEFAGGLMGYSSAPLYQQSVDALQANRPAQYEAITGMFIDPITGEMTGRDYRATPAQTASMISGGGAVVGGGGGGAPDYTPAPDGGTGYWQGGELTGLQTESLSGPEFEAYTLAHGLPSAEETLGDKFRQGLDDTIYGKIHTELTGNTISGATDDIEFNWDDHIGGGRAEPEPPSAPAGDWGYDDDYNDPNLWGFSEAATPAPEMVTAAPDTSFPMGVEEDLSLSATAKPYATGILSEATPSIDPSIATKQAADAKAAKAKAKKVAKDKADYQAAQAKKTAKAKAEAIIQAQLDEEEAFNKAEVKRKAKARAEADRKANAEAKRVADALEKQTKEIAAKAAAKKKADKLKAKQAADAKAAKAKAKKAAKARADYLASQVAAPAPAPAPKPYKRYSQADALAAKNGYAGVSGGGGR